jgi:uncharacterized protein (TIGR00269 family)
LITVTIDEGIHTYRTPQMHKLKAYLQELKMQGKIHDFIIKEIKSLGFTMDEVKKILELEQAKGEPKTCAFCGIFRRYLLSKAAKEIKADKIAFGHNLDDIIQTQLMNIFDNNLEKFLSISPKLESPCFVEKIIPFANLSEKEIAAYALFNEINVFFEECPYSIGSKRFFFREELNRIEDAYMGSKHKIKNFLNSLGKLLENEQGQKTYKIKTCIVCGEPTAKEKCNSCKMIEELTSLKQILKKNNKHKNN